MIDLLANMLKEIKEISDFLRSPYGMHGEELSDRIRRLNGHSARLPEIIATAEYILLNKKAEASENIMRTIPGITATLLKIKIEAECSNEIKAVKFAERLDAACVHQIDGLRSQLSYLKSLND